VTEDERAKLAYFRAELSRMYAQAVEADRCDQYELRWAALALLACAFIALNVPEHRWAVDALLVAVGFRVGRVLANVESAIRRWWRSRV